jgi:hypothetical protein
LCSFEANSLGLSFLGCTHSRLTIISSIPSLGLYLFMTNKNQLIAYLGYPYPRLAIINSVTPLDPGCAHSRLTIINSLSSLGYTQARLTIISELSFLGCTHSGLTIISNLSSLGLYLLMTNKNQLIEDLLSGTYVIFIQGHQ